MTASHRLQPWLAAALVAASGAAWSALGQPAPALGAPSSATAVAAQTAAGARYTVHTRRLDTGTEVREYADAGGTVFAVAWSGPFLPDLRALLGTHFAAMEQHAATAPRSSAVHLQRADLVLQLGGRMGAFRGRAWLPTQLPAGFDPRELP